ncbi:MAG: hypothetical protein M0013_04090 [Actinomycetota bacterium]|nr:hypothetical protein [Actinomycetota bacterium]
MVGTGDAVDCGVVVGGVDDPFVDEGVVDVVVVGGVDDPFVDEGVVDVVVVGCADVVVDRDEALVAGAVVGEVGGDESVEDPDAGWTVESPLPPWRDEPPVAG